MNQDKIDEIKNNILKELERNKKEKEELKLKKKENKITNRNLEVPRKWQQKYVDLKKKDGKTQVAAFVEKDNLINTDDYIIKNAKQLKKINRSDVINIALKFFFENNKE